MPDFYIDVRFKVNADTKPNAEEIVETGLFCVDDPRILEHKIVEKVIG